MQTSSHKGRFLYTSTLTQSASCLLARISSCGLASSGSRLPSTVWHNCARSGFPKPLQVVQILESSNMTRYKYIKINVDCVEAIWAAVSANGSPRRISSFGHLEPSGHPVPKQHSDGHGSDGMNPRTQVVLLPMISKGQKNTVPKNRWVKVIMRSLLVSFSLLFHDLGRSLYFDRDASIFSSRIAPLVFRKMH